MKDYYNILEVNKASDKEEIKTAYKKLALKYHPDKNMDNKEAAEIKFKEIGEAYEILSDNEKKNNYDNGQNIIIHNHNPFDIFENMFKQRHHSFNIDISNLHNMNSNFSSVNTSTIIIGNKKIIKTEKIIQTPNGTQTIIEERVELI